MGEVAADQMLEIDGVFALHECRLVVAGWHVGACQGAFLPFLVEELEDSSDLSVAFGVAPAAEGVAVPEDAVVVGRDYEGHRHFGVVLVEFLVLSLVVEFVALVLSQAVDAFVFGKRLEGLPYGVAFRAFHFNRGELPSPFGFGEDQLALLVVELHVAACEGDSGLDGGCHHRYRGVGLLHVVFHVGRTLEHCEARVFGKFAVGRGADADDLVAIHLQAHLADARFLRIADIDGHSARFFLVGSAATRCYEHAAEQEPRDCG